MTIVRCHAGPQTQARSRIGQPAASRGCPACWPKSTDVERGVTPAKNVGVLYQGKFTQLAELTLDHSCFGRDHAHQRIHLYPVEGPRPRTTINIHVRFPPTSPIAQQRKSELLYRVDVECFSKNRELVRRIGRYTRAYQIFPRSKFH
jgi:hypothetical protein